jgi:hypothetical protein
MQKTSSSGLKQFYGTSFFDRSPRAPLNERPGRTYVIHFFLDIVSKELYKGDTSAHRGSRATLLDVVKGESLDEERNQEESGRQEEGAREEESGREEEEVSAADSQRSSPNTSGPEQSGPFSL